MNINIRQETDLDYKLSESVVKRAFENAEHTDRKEQFLVANLRKSSVFIPELSLVAEYDGEIVGHIMFTKLVIKDGERENVSLALAPVSVLPKHQNKGIGGLLVNEGLKIAKGLGFKSVIVLGHEKYYPRFGFKPSSLWNIKPPFDVPEEVFMALELENGSLKEISGTVVYPEEFYK